MNKTNKFQLNRSSILRNILNNRGWEDANSDDIIDFSYWDTYGNNNRKNGKIMVI